MNWRISLASRRERGAVKCSKEDVEEGSVLLKGLLGRWREECEGGELSSEEMVERMRDLVKGDERLCANPFFQSVRAL